MKIWFGYGSEHSMNLVMIGQFKSINDAKEAEEIIEQIGEQFRTDTEAGLMELGGLSDSFSEPMLELLQKHRVYDIRPSELEVFACEFTVQAEGNELVVRTDESDVVALVKILLHKGALVEVYSAHEYPEKGNGRG